MYLVVMASQNGKHTASRLRTLREAAGLSQYELAARIGERQSNVHYWETTGKLPRSNVLVPLAKALGVTVEELLGQPRSRRVMTPGGQLGHTFEKISRLSRNSQKRIIGVIEALILQEAGANK